MGCLTPLLFSELIILIHNNITVLIALITSIFLLSLPFGYIEHQIIVNKYRSHEMKRIIHNILNDFILDIQNSNNCNKIERPFFGQFDEVSKMSFLTEIFDLFLNYKNLQKGTSIRDRLGTLWSHFYARKAVGYYAPIVTTIIYLPIYLSVLFYIPINLSEINIIISIAIFGIIWIIGLIFIDPYSDKIWYEINFLEMSFLVSEIKNIEPILKEIIFYLMEHPEYLRKGGVLFELGAINFSDGKMSKIELLGFIPDVEKIIASSSKATRSKPAAVLLRDMDEEEARKHIGRVMSYGHEGISEFAFFIFSVSGISRVLTHQLVRHRIASYLQMSSRHTDLSELDFLIPPKIKDNPEAYRMFMEFIKYARSNYKKLLELGIHKEDARYLIPDSIETHIVIGMNARALNNFFGHRLCEKAQWEIRYLANKMKELVKKETPSLFWSEHRPCVIRGKCPQIRSCGFWKKEEFKIERKKYLEGYPIGKK